MKHLLLALLLPLTALAGEPRTETYKTAGGAKLDATIYFPDGWKADDKRPAIVFFFGGGWVSGTPRQFENHSRYLASRGMVAITADYRVKSRQNAKPADCVADAKSAIRWARANAARLGIDPQRIAAAGGSAGGHIAAATATLPGLDDPADDKAVSCVPNALVLFNPALVLAPIEGTQSVGFEKEMTAERFGCPPAEISPAHNVKAGAPPAIIFHGKADTTVAYESAEIFTHRMKAAGNRCELVSFDGQGHGFFNFGKTGDKFAHETLTGADRFLASLGWLQGEPTVETFFTTNPPSPSKK